MTELDELFDEGVRGAEVREGTEFDRLAALCGDVLVLFGAGGLGRLIERKLRGVGPRPVAFADNNEKLWGQSIEGVPVLSPGDAAARFGDSAAFVVAVWGVGSKDRMAARVGQLKELGCRVVVPFPALFWKYPDLFLPYHVIDQPRKVLQEAAAVQAAYGLWSDEFSRREYVAQIRWRLRGDFDSMADPVEEPIYFPDVCKVRGDETFVDCGAFDGDTVQAFLGATKSSFSRIFAFEPDPSNFARLQRFVDGIDPTLTRRVVTRQNAVGAAAGTVRFAADGTDGSAIRESGDLDVECVALDEVFENEAPSYIKMDVEGAELDALSGSRQLIGGRAPVLAICSYHRQSDLWRIPLLIQSYNSDYRFYLRPHLVEGWDVVCYAVPRERMAA
jgi:FkbM family methyltransferase